MSTLRECIQVAKSLQPTKINSPETYKLIMQIVFKIKQPVYRGEKYNDSHLINQFMGA